MDKEALKKSKTLSLKDLKKYFASDAPITSKVAAIIGFECALQVSEIVALDCVKVKFDRRNDEVQSMFIRTKTTNILHHSISFIRGKFFEDNMTYQTIFLIR